MKSNPKYFLMNDVERQSKYSPKYVSFLQIFVNFNKKFPISGSKQQSERANSGVFGLLHCAIETVSFILWKILIKNSIFSGIFCLTRCRIAFGTIENWGITSENRCNDMEPTFIFFRLKASGVQVTPSSEPVHIDDRLIHISQKQPSEWFFDFYLIKF